MADEAVITRGYFITFEGGEGTGKSTQIGLLADALTATGIEVQKTREPGGSPGAEEIRDLLVRGEPGRWDPMTEILLLYAARNDHYRRRIEPALAAGHWVLCDRFADSTLAYQGAGGGIELETIRSLHSLVLGRVWPDLTVLLDLDVETGLERAGQREETTSEGGETRYERMGGAFHDRLRQGYLSLAADAPERFAVVDASQSIAIVAGDVADKVAGRFDLILEPRS
jgi:dTMP kinase